MNERLECLRKALDLYDLRTLAALNAQRLPCKFQRSARLPLMNERLSGRSSYMAGEVTAHASPRAGAVPRALSSKRQQDLAEYRFVRRQTVGTRQLEVTIA
ncbi:hypothetical protein PoB_006867200 [Plakobranchus ocellatus]|uniref:Uncharacterized protein n=1 Tax=Plakobranchus ocellatus TaxID=259542 RepID=A0AAV4DD35_9GAST|nr:hypothetical protein PoB_006867200 [Plakobranchus ocellatus]